MQVTIAKAPQPRNCAGLCRVAHHLSERRDGIQGLLGLAVASGSHLVSRRAWEHDGIHRSRRQHRYRDASDFGFHHRLVFSRRIARPFLLFVLMHIGALRQFGRALPAASSPAAGGEVGR